MTDVYLRVRLNEETGELIGYEFLPPPASGILDDPAIPPRPQMPQPPIANPTINVQTFIRWLYDKIFGEPAPAEPQSTL